jgi:hypothetical protein
MLNTDTTPPAIDKANYVRPGLEYRPFGVASGAIWLGEPLQIKSETGLTSIFGM